jgi:hypothetical protein
MHEPLQLSGTDHIAYDRVAELRSLAHEVHVPRRPPAEIPGLVTRTRSLLGRRLISLGSTVAGHHA